jgi:Domain of unknown function (DUF6438)
MMQCTFVVIALISSNIFAAQLTQKSPVKSDARDAIDVTITLEHLGCPGECPAFSVEIHGEGTVIYVGKDNVKVKGKREHKIPKERVAELLKEFDSASYFSLKDEYVPYSGPGLSIAVNTYGVGTSISIGGKEKSVYESFGAPKSLKDLEVRIYGISEVHQYVTRP